MFFISILSLFALISERVVTMATQERTFIMIKPDGVQRGLVGKIIQRFEQKGFKLVAMKVMWVSVKSAFIMILACIAQILVLAVRNPVQLKVFL